MLEVIPADTALQLDGGPDHYRFSAPSGFDLRVYQWAVEDPSGVAVLVHGLEGDGRTSFLSKRAPVSFKADMISRLQRLAEACDLRHDRQPTYIIDEETDLTPDYEASAVQYLNDRGMDVVSFDHQSYGLSQGLDGLREHWTDVDALARDFRALIAAIREASPQPVAVLAVDAGAVVVTRMMQLDPLEAPIDALLLLGGLWTPGADFSSLFHWGTGWLMPSLVSCAHTLPAEYPWLEKYEASCPYMHSEGVRNSVLSALTTATGHLLDDYHKSQALDITIVHNRFDPRALFAGALDLSDKLQSSGVPCHLVAVNSSHSESSLDRDITLTLVPGLEGVDVLHSLLAEPDQEAVLEYAVGPALKRAGFSIEVRAQKRQRKAPKVASDLKDSNDTEEKAKQEAEVKAKEESEKKARDEAEAKEKEAEMQAKAEAATKEKEEAEAKEKEEAEKKAREEAEAKEKEEAEAKEKEEAEKKAREEAQAKEKEEEDSSESLSVSNAPPDAPIQDEDAPNSPEDEDDEYEYVYEDE
ncbi:MAG: uncharacterized protein KVP18_003541 [Porospora cf. gigantea A]|uniref:uncharacterized protein n=1 Tax=Porospora cf. gigantea A TaxID=2853593 RepID=UPI00355A72CD|nr:MAG: hypothetical protein KVP18_003541 [Porospora cf. gigantea A]